MKVDVDASNNSISQIYQKDQHGVRTNRKSEVDPVLVENEPLFTFTSGFDKVEKQDLRDT